MLHVVLIRRADILCAGSQGGGDICGIVVDFWKSVQKVHENY